MLVTLPEHDLATKYASAWSQQIINTAERNDIQTIIVKGQSVTKSNVVNAIENKDLILLYLMVMALKVLSQVIISNL